MKAACVLAGCLLAADVSAPSPDKPPLDSEVYCLALNIYHEARGEDYLAQLAVADVTMNRVESKAFPNSVCEVVTEAKMKLDWRGDAVPIRHQCQFSWFCDGMDDTPEDGLGWRNALAVATNEDFRGITRGALFYHSTSVMPFWANSFIRLGTIGNHVFYRPPSEK